MTTNQKSVYTSPLPEIHYGSMQFIAISRDSFVIISYYHKEYHIGAGIGLSHHRDSKY